MDGLDVFVEAVLLWPKAEGNKWHMKMHVKGRQAQIIAMQISTQDQIAGITLFPDTIRKHPNWGQISW